MNDGYHLSLSLSRELWEDLLEAALPVTLSEGRLDVVSITRSAARQLAVRERIAGLLEDQGGFRTPLRLRERTRGLRRRAQKVLDARRDDLVQRARQVAYIDATWKIELDDVGSRIRYGTQRLDADAWVKGTAQGTVYLLRENIELPFQVERRIGASVGLGDIHYDDGHRAVIGQLRDLALHAGDRALYQLLARLGERALEGQLDGVNPVPILRRDQVQEMVGGMGEALRVKMGIETLKLRIDRDAMTLSVRFGFERPRVEGKERARLEDAAEA